MGVCWIIPWTEEPSGLKSIGHKELDVTEQLTFGLVRNRTGNLFMEQILVLEVDHKVLLLPHALLTVSIDYKESENLVMQSCLTLSDSMDWSPPGSSVHRIFQARVLEWVAISFST